MLDLFGGLYQLARLAVISGFRLKGKYWTWRHHTAFGAGVPVRRSDMFKAVIEYGIWVHKMRR
jgi:hypothetical protein